MQSTLFEACISIRQKSYPSKGKKKKREEGTHQSSSKSRRQRREGRIQTKTKTNHSLLLTPPYDYYCKRHILLRNLQQQQQKEPTEQMSFYVSNLNNVNAVVADIGSYSTKIGYAGDDYPKAYFRSVRVSLFFSLFFFSLFMYAQYT